MHSRRALGGRLGPGRAQTRCGARVEALVPAAERGEGEKEGTGGSVAVLFTWIACSWWWEREGGREGGREGDGSRERVGKTGCVGEDDQKEPSQMERGTLATLLGCLGAGVRGSGRVELASALRLHPNDGNSLPAWAVCRCSTAAVQGSNNATVRGRAR